VFLHSEMRYSILIIFVFLPIYLFTQNSSDTLKIAVYDSPPFGMKTNSGKIGGLMVELWEDIADEMNVEYSYVLTDMEGVLSGLREGTYDVGLGAISITPAREEMVDFTHAVNPSGTGIAVSESSYSASILKKWGPILVNLLELIGIILLMLLISAVIVFFIEKRYSREELSERSINSIADGLWWSAVTMTTVGYGDKVPRSKFGRILGIIWIFTSILFFSLFTANASATLANSKTTSDINTLDDLRQVKVVAVSNSSGEEFLIRENINYSVKDDIEDAIESVLSGEADAVISNVPVLKYHNKTNYAYKLIISENYLLRNNMGIALQENSPLKETINLLLLEKISEAKWQQAVYKYIGD
jgi:polar amino acid transport system substrate-binding protein